MEYKEFKENLRKRIQREYAEADVYTETAEKNNGTKKERLVIRERGKKVVSCIYLKELYQRHEKTGDMELCVQMVKRLAVNKEEVSSEVGDIIEEWEECRRRIMLRLVNREWNRERLKTVPYKEFLDLAVTFHMLVKKTEDAVCSLPVTNEIMKIWGTSTDELFQAGMKNLHERTHFEVSGIGRFISEAMKKELGIGVEKEKRDSEEERLHEILLQNMLVLSAVPYCYGAIGMLATGYLNEIADQSGAFYIMPSSVHELILIPEFMELSADSLRSMVRMVNQTKLLPEERLSDSLYYFNPESGKVELAED